MNFFNQYGFFQIDFSEWIQRLCTAYSLMYKILSSIHINKKNIYHLLHQIHIAGIGSLTIVLLTSCFMGMVFTLQVAKEFTSLNVTNLVGTVLTTTFVRELAPVLTAIIVAARIGSAFTAEIATMKVTDQIDVLFVLNTDPFYYLVIPRVYACIFMLPILNIFSLATSFSSSMFVGFILYNIPASVFIASSTILFLDFIYSLLKAIFFGLIIGVISCSWGLSTIGGSKNVGRSTTSSVVTTLVIIFIADFILSYLMFNNARSMLHV